MQLNQPAGHLEDGESLIEAVIRETREETAWRFVPQALVGVYRWRHPQKNDTYLRFCFCGQAVEHFSAQALDADIERALWLSRDQIKQQTAFRSPLVLQCFEDYWAGQRYPLELFHD